MPKDDPAMYAALIAIFDPASEDGEVDERDLVDFLKTVGEYHLDKTIGDREYAKSINAAGYVTKHGIAELTEDDLRGLGLKHAHARAVSKYLPGREAFFDAPPAPSADPALSVVTALSNTSAQLGAAMAAAIESQKDLGALDKGAEGRSSVEAAVAWARACAKSKALSNNGLKAVITDLAKNIMMDLDPSVSVEPMSTADKAAFSKVRDSLTTEQYDLMGGNETESASKLIQNVLQSAAKTPMEKFIKDLSTFLAIGTTHAKHAVKQRFKHFKTKLLEVRYHKMFEMDKAITGLADVIAPHTTMVHEALTKWTASAKDQQALSDILVYLDQPIKDKHEEPSNTTESGSNNTPTTTPSSNKKAKPYRKEPQSAQSSTKAVKNGGICNSFAKYGNCIRGDACPHRHVAPENKTINQVFTTQINKTTQPIKRQLAELQDLVERQNAMIEQTHQANTSQNRFEQLLQFLEGDGASMQRVYRARSQVKRARAPTNQQMLKSKLQQARELAAAVLGPVKGPVMDSATDTDVIGKPHMKYVTNKSENLATNRVTRAYWIIYN